ncbi:uncharacterized protein [Anabrus simplex]|uniref:uncharacterized protein n=1 Tax=Anabrus simplex TaxID=316456 RepID=UPI0035A3003C
MTPTWLTADFVQEILRTTHQNNSISVKNIKIEPAIPKGNNFMGVLYRVHLDVNDNEVKKSLIVKTQAQGEYMNMVTETCGFFPREIRMYAAMFPAMYKLSQGKLDNYIISPMYFPCSMKDVIIMEDLVSQGFQMKERRLQFDFVHSVSAFKTLAKFHAMSMAVNVHDPTMKDHFEDFYDNDVLRSIFGRFLASSLASLAKKLEKWPGQEYYAAKVHKISENVTDTMAELSKPGPLMVLNHGDIWVNNILFRYNGNEITDVRIVDFQMTKWASPANDLYYLLYSSVQEQVREQHADTLLSEYHATLSDTLTALGCSQEIFSLQQLHQEMKDKIFYGFLHASLTLCVTLAEPCGVMDTESFELKDMDDGHANPIEQSEFSPRFREVFPKVLRYFEENGVL